MDTETTFRAFLLQHYPDAQRTLFDKNGLRGLLAPDQVSRRNGAAHEAIMTHQDAHDARDWALAVLRCV